MKQKKINDSLEDTYQQIQKYIFNLNTNEKDSNKKNNIEIGITTNGIKYKFYLIDKNGTELKEIISINNIFNKNTDIKDKLRCIFYISKDNYNLSIFKTKVKEYNEKANKREDTIQVLMNSGYTREQAESILNKDINNINNINNSSSNNTSSSISKQQQNEKKIFTEEYHFQKTSNNYILDLYKKIKQKLLYLSNNVNMKIQQEYIGYQVKNKTFVDIIIQKDKLKIFFNVKKGSLMDKENKTLNMADKGHLGNGDYCIDINEEKDIDYVMNLATQSYNINEIKTKI